MQSNLKFQLQDVLANSCASYACISEKVMMRSDLSTSTLSKLTLKNPLTRGLRRAAGGSRAKPVTPTIRLPEPSE